MELPALEALFMRGIWARAIPDATDTAWVDRVARQPRDNEPCGDYGPLVRRMLDAGVTAQEIARFSQIECFHAAGRILFYLDDKSVGLDGFVDADELGTFDWGLFAIDPMTDEPGQRMEGLYELLLSFDPSGREMRPGDVD